jgi:hypothetical protein
LIKIIDNVNAKCSDLINEIVAASEIKLSLIIELNNSNMNNYGECGNRIMCEYEAGNAFKKYLNEDWRYAIRINKSVTDVIDECPAYFIYVFGHELGHVKATEYCFETNIYNSLLRDNIAHCEKNKKFWPWDLPVEDACEKFGIYLARLMLSDLTANIQLQKLFEKKEFKTKYNRRALSLNGKPDFSNLWNAMVEMALPYKELLTTEWNKWYEHNDSCEIHTFYIWAKEKIGYENFFILK